MLRLRNREKMPLTPNENVLRWSMNCVCRVLNVLLFICSVCYGIGWGGSSCTQLILHVFNCSVRLCTLCLLAFFRPLLFHSIRFFWSFFFSIVKLCSVFFPVRCVLLPFFSILCLILFASLICVLFGSLIWFSWILLPTSESARFSSIPFRFRWWFDRIPSAFVHMQILNERETQILLNR